MANEGASGGRHDRLEDRLRSMILENVQINQDGRARGQLRQQPRAGHSDRRMYTSSSRSEKQVTRPPPSNKRRGKGGAIPRDRELTVENASQLKSTAEVTEQSSSYAQKLDPPAVKTQSSSKRFQKSTSRPIPHSMPARDNQYSHPAPVKRPQTMNIEQFRAQCSFLELEASRVLPSAEMSSQEYQEKERFRDLLESASQDAASKIMPQYTLTVQLKTFGSLGSGMGTPGCDMDLALFTSFTHPELPRLIEEEFLHRGFGARLLTRTRVPILKVCEKPTEELLYRLRAEREKWNNMTAEEREEFDHPIQMARSRVQLEAKDEVSNSKLTTEKEVAGTRPMEPDSANESPVTSISAEGGWFINPDPPQPVEMPKPARIWYRERALGPLDFPKNGVGIQCDINFSNPLGIHNTELLRCYALCDVRVRLLVLFIKVWASARKINSSRNGTLCSYGYALMVLHYLVNVTHPAICPNLQHAYVQKHGDTPPNITDPTQFCAGYDIRFWSNEAEISSLAARSMLTHNRQNLGELLRGFFHYFAHNGPDVPHGGFRWTQDVLSLRTPGGLLTKQQKGWTGAKTTIEDSKEVRHRYLFAIEDPFEHDHNVARPITHNGIVAIRDEFRRAWRIITQAGRGISLEGELLAKIISQQPLSEPEQLTSETVLSNERDRGTTDFQSTLKSRRFEKEENPGEAENGKSEDELKKHVVW